MPRLGLGFSGFAHDLVGSDPDFINPAGDNYHLGASSEAIDVGANVGITRDIDGDTRPMGAGFDIGYDEAAPCVTNVTTNADNGAGSLRAALACAAPNSTLTFALAPNSIIALTTGELVVTKPLTINGATATNLRVDANNASRVFNLSAPATLISLTVTRGKASGNGGGINSTSALTLTNVAVLSNTASSNGGGVNASNTTLTNGLFQNNGAHSGGGLYASGLTLSGTQFLNNNAFNGNGGGAGVEGGASVIGGLFRDNTANATGGGLSTNGTLAISNTQFIANSGTFGSAVYHSAGNGRIVNTLFARNDAYVLWLASPASVQILHSTIASPTVSSGLNVGIYGLTGTIGITDSIIASQTVGIYESSALMYGDYNLLAGNTSPTAGPVFGGGHNASGNPAFVNPAADNYHLKFGSAAIDTGIAVGITRDFDGDVRPQGLAPDIGYDEANGILRLYLPAILR